MTNYIHILVNTEKTTCKNNFAQFISALKLSRTSALPAPAAFCSPSQVTSTHTYTHTHNYAEVLVITFAFVIHAHCCRQPPAISLAITTCKSAQINNTHTHSHAFKILSLKALKGTSAEISFVNK